MQPYRPDEQLHVHACATGSGILAVMTQAVPQYLRELGAFAAGTTLETLPAQARESGRTILADCIPVIGAGMQVPQMQRFCASYLDSAAPGTAWVIGARRRAAARDAAFLNGTAGTWLELDEGNLLAKGHPGIQVVPAAIAVAQESGASGAALLLAATLGYEICSRLARAAKLKLSVHPHGTWGVIGAAVAVAKLKGFSAPQMTALLNVAATLGLGTSRGTLLEGSTVRNLFTGHSAHMGIAAAQAVEAGFTGQADAPAAVFGSVLSDGFDAARAVAGLGTEWMVTQGYFKLHPTGRYVHAAIDALEDAFAASGRDRLAPQEIERIDVRAYKLAAMLCGKEITTSFGARFSIPFALATLLHHGRSSLAAFDDAAVANREVQDLVQRVFIEEETEYTAQYPALQRCDLRIRLRSGEVIEGHCRIMKGEPQNPHSHAELERKFLDLGRTVWGEAPTRRLHQACRRIEEIEDFAVFSQSLEL